MYLNNIRNPEGYRIELVDNKTDTSVEDRVKATKEALGLLPNKELADKASAIKQEMEGKAPNPELDARVEESRRAIEGKKLDPDLVRRLDETKRALYGSNTGSE